jgi:hypothetical protein
MQAKPRSTTQRILPGPESGRVAGVRGRLLLAGTMLAAIVITAIITTTLMVIEPAASKADAFRTGGLAGGALIAFYALWVNDRRRRTEEARHELESDKVADERFGRSVELLGNDADQVRVGALHALAGLSGSTPRYRQTVLDVLCAYLRMPITDDTNGRERQVRLTAQRLITDTLPWGHDPDPRAFHLDLTGATLEDFRLEGRRIGRLIAPRSCFNGTTAWAGLRATKPVLLTGAVFNDRVDLHDAQLLGGLSMRDAAFSGEVTVTGATVGTFVDLRTTPPASLTGTLTVADDGTRIDGDPAPWISRPPG